MTSFFTRLPKRLWPLRGGLGDIGADMRGALMLDAVIAMLTFSMVGFAVMGGLSTTQLSSNAVEGQTVAENLARNQLEVAFAAPYISPPTTFTTVAVPDGYGITAVAEEYVQGDGNIQKIVVTVSRDGASVLTVETLRVKQ
jgi:hypothetical protein